MKNKLECSVVSREGLAEHLRHTEITGSQASGETSIYHCHGNDGESVVVALPGNGGLIVRLPKPAAAVDRRRGRR